MPGKQIPIGENLFTSSEGKANLLGTHCKSCGDYFFPKTFTCHDPKCKTKDIEDVKLNRKGKVTSYSVMAYPPPPPYIAPANYVPIPVVAVELPEGINIIGMMEGCEPKNVKIGMEVETVISVLYTDENKDDILGWKFKPV
jgi:hypothetical protein